MGSSSASATLTSELSVRAGYTYEFSVAEEVDPVAVDGFAVLGPGEGGDGVTLDGSGDPQLLTLVHGNVAERAREGGHALGDALLHAGLDRHGGRAAGVSLAVEGNRGVGT